MNLTEKIELLIRRKQLTPTQFSELIGIPRSNVSHILSGRNKPSLDVVQRILNAFPEVIVESLLFEDRNLAFDESFGISSPAPKTEEIKSSLEEKKTNIQQTNLFDPEIPSPRESNKNNLVDKTTENPNLKPIEKIAENSEKESANNNPTTTTTNQSIELPSKVSSHVYKKIERVIIFYSDGTFSESRPSS